MSASSRSLDVLRSKSLAQAAQQEIMDLILRGEFEAGDKLSEASMAERLAVSRGPIREAFRALEEVGLLRFSKNRGVFVKEITLKDIEELYEVRIGLDAVIGRILAPRITDAELEALRGITDKMDEALSRNALADYFLTNLEFHEKIVVFTRNQKLVDIYKRITNEMHLMRRRSIIEGGGLLVSNEEHKEIVDALATRDGDVAARVLAAHGAEGRARLLDTLTRMEAEGSGSVR